MRDGLGIYTLPLPPVVSGGLISASHFNTTMGDIADAITQSFAVSGETPLTAAVKFVDGTPTAPAITFNSENSSGFFRPTAQALAISILGSEIARFHESSLLIGTTTNTGEPLQVGGNTKVNGTVYANRLETMGLGNIVSGGNVVSSGNVYATLNLMGQRVLLNQGSLAEPSINLNGYGAGIWWPTSGEMEFVGDGVSIGRFGVNKTEVNDALIVRATGADNAIVEIGKDRATSASAILRMRSTGTGAANPVYDFAMSRTSGDNGVMYFLQQGTGRMQFESKSSECRFVTSATSITNRYVAATTSPDNGVFETSVSSAGQVSLILRNAALSQSLTPYYITRNGTGGISTQVFRVGGDITTGLGSTSALTLSETGATLGVPITGKAFVNTATTQTLFSGATDLTADYPLMVSKSGGGATTTGIAIGSNNVDRSTLVFNQLNSSGTRLISSRIVGMNSSNTAGAEKGYLVFDTKSASDASAVARLTLSEVAAAFAEPITTTGEVSTATGTEAVPAFSFTTDTDTGMYRSAANNLDFSTGGVRRFQIDSSGRLYGYSAGGDLLTLKTAANNGLLQIDTTSGTANINNLTWYLTSSGSALLILRNDAKSAYISPISIQRNASSGTSNVSFRVGGDSNINGSDVEAGRFVVSSDGTQGKLLVGHTAQDIYLNHGDATPTNNFQIHSYKTGGNGPVSLLGTDGTNTSYWASARTNTGSKRVVQTQIGGVSVSSTAGAEKGKLELSTKAAADAGVVVRASIDETGASFTVPVTASNLSYNTKVVAGALTQDGIYSTAAGFTLNTSDCATGRVFQVYNNSAAAITITQGAGLTMRLVGTATTGNRTLAQRGMCRITCISGTEVIVEGTT